MCFWYMDHGRCGDSFPQAKNEFLFISDDFVTNPVDRRAKQECLNRKPAPLEQQINDNFYDSSDGSSEY